VRLLILAVGRARNSPEDAIAQTYLERCRALGPTLGFARTELVVIETGRAATAVARMADEAKRLAQRIPKGAFAIALDEAGRGATSAKFAALLGAQRDAGAKDCVFLIGGPDGLLEDLRRKAQERLAFGAQTWPHMLVRTMLAEQIFRAFAILAGHPYHRGKQR